MRYAKGSLAVSPSRDVPVLLGVRNARFITHQQLYELMRSQGHEYSRKSFNWRTKRLLDSGLIALLSGHFGRGGVVYSITTSGLLHLEDHGEFATVLNSKTGHLPHPAAVHHALELNNIHLALVRSGMLAAWRSDIETASANTISTAPLGKDYDAVVDVWNGDTLARFALEYERTLKSARQYERIRLALEDPDQVGCVLYLGAGPEVVLHLLHEFSGIPKRLAFATAQAFRQQLLDTPVMTHPHQPVMPFRGLLVGGLF
jgi:hypothetical protein